MFLHKIVHAQLGSLGPLIRPAGVLSSLLMTPLSQVPSQQTSTQGSTAARTLLLSVDQLQKGIVVLVHLTCMHTKVGSILVVLVRVVLAQQCVWTWMGNVRVVEDDDKAQWWCALPHCTLIMCGYIIWECHAERDRTTQRCIALHATPPCARLRAAFFSLQSICSTCLPERVLVLVFGLCRHSYVRDSALCIF